MFPLPSDSTTRRGVGRWTLRSCYDFPGGGKQRVVQKHEFIIFLLLQYMARHFVFGEQGSERNWSVLRLVQCGAIQEIPRQAEQYCMAIYLPCT